MVFTDSVSKPFVPSSFLPCFLLLTTTLLLYKLHSGFQFPSDRWISHILAVKANKFMEDRFA